MVDCDIDTSGQSPKFNHVNHVEIANAPVAYLACINQFGECFECFLERHVAAPMEQIEVEAVRSKAA